VKVLVFGATGMVGQGVLLECLDASGVDRVVAVGRSPTGRRHPKLEEIVVPNLRDLGAVEDRLRGFDAAFFCLGVSSVGRSEAEYRATTYDLTVSVAGVVARRSPEAVFTYVSGAGTDSTERGRVMWARVKGATENAILRLPFRGAYLFRPGVILPRRGVRSRTRGVRIVYAVLGPVFSLVFLLAPGTMTTSDRLGRAMLRVAAEGAPTRWLGTREINALGATTSRATPRT
jgi:uncharacterized protein YbjT (DUF2867 family)